MTQLKRCRTAPDAAMILKRVEEDLPPEEVVRYLNVDYYRFRKTVELLPPAAQDDEFLDVGVGRGILLRAAAVLGYAGVGVEYYTHRVMQERYLKWNIPIFQCDISREKLPFDPNRFAIVGFCELLEHLPTSPASPLSELLRVTRPGGKLILTTPNCANLRKRLALLTGHSNYCPVDVFFDRDLYERHNREYTLSEVCWLLERTGWRVEGASWWSTHLWPSKHTFIINGRDVCGWQRNIHWMAWRTLALLPYAVLTSCLPSLREVVAVVATKPY